METGVSRITHGIELSENQVLKKALLSSKIENSEMYDVDNAVSMAIDRAIFYLGYKTPEKDKTLIKLAVIDDLKRHFFNLTVSEISIVIDNGSHGRYGDVIGLAPKDVYKWFTSYSNSQERKHALSLLDKEKLLTPELTEDEKSDMYWGNMLAAFDQYKRKGFFNDYGNAVYNMLDINGKIYFTDEKKLEFVNQAFTNLRKEFNPLNHIANKPRMLEYEKILEDIKGNPKHVRVVSEAKRIALTEMFAGMVEMGITIQDLFSE